MKKQGKGNRSGKTEAITNEEINILYEKKSHGKKTPETLLYSL